MLTKVLTRSLTFTSLKPCDLSTCTKEEIRNYFINSYELNDSLFTSLKDETAFYKCPDRLRLPLIFYYAHTSVVYINKLVLAGLIKKRVNLDFETLFETGVDEMSWDDTENYRMGGSFKWPSLDEVTNYRRLVFKVVLDVIETTTLELPVTMESHWWSLFMGMEHERIHIETSSVLIRQLPIKLVQKPDGWNYAPFSADEPVVNNPMIKVDSCDITLGKPNDFPSYGWDNEYGKVDCKIPCFEASKYLITNWEFVDFVKAGCYGKQEYWTEEGWEWVKFKQANHPIFWVCGNGCKSGCGADLSSYSHCTYNGQACTVDIKGHREEQNGGISELEFGFRLMFDVVELALDWPAEVNYHEAKAFCTWKGAGYRLLSEAEHNLIRGKQVDPAEGTNCDIIYEDKIMANLNFQYGSSTPVNMYPASELGFHDAFGNVWEWVEDHFNGFPGYQSHYLYDDFSSPTFDGRHNVILGGSWISTGDEASRFARYAFRRHFFQHCGFRLARTITSESVSEQSPIRLVSTEVFVLGVGILDNPITLNAKFDNPVIVPSTNLQHQYEEEKYLQRILEDEYGYRELEYVSMVKAISEEIKADGVQIKNVLHLGCGTGRVSFELTRYFDEVVAVDYVGRFIDTCLTLQKNKSLLSVVAKNNNKKRAKAEIVTPSNYDVDKVVFKQLTWLPNEVGEYDFVLCLFLNRLLNPKAWLVRLGEVVSKKGTLAILTSSVNEDNLKELLKDKFILLKTESISIGNANGLSTIITFKHVK